VDPIRGAATIGIRNNRHVPELDLQVQWRREAMGKIGQDWFYLPDFYTRDEREGFVIDIEEIVRRVRGRCAVLGNLDAIDLLSNGSEAQLRAEISRQIAAGRQNDSRFVMSIGSPVTPKTPIERVRLYCDLVHELGGLY
jgi:uroporphyrinogen-III decarboxylase